MLTKRTTFLKNLLSVLFVLLTMSACGGGGGGNNPPPIDPGPHAIRGTVYGLDNGNTVVIQNNGAGDLSISNRGSFSFIAEQENDTSYDVTVLTQPTGPEQDCMVVNGRGTVTGADISNIAIVCRTTTFNHAYGFDSGIETAIPAEDGSGDMYVGGYFTAYNSTIQRRLVRLNSDGTIDAGFDTGAGFNNSVLSVAIAEGGSGDIYVGGNFTSYNGTTVNRLVRLNSDGSIDTTFDVGSGFDLTVNSIAIANDGTGDIYVGGSFTSYQGTTINRIARLNSDGSIDTGFNVGAGFDSDVETIAVATDGSGDVYIGGKFLNYDVTGINRIVRVNNDGSIDTGFSVGTGANNVVETIIVAQDGSGDVYVGGWLTNYNGTTSNRIIRINSNGTVDAGFSIGTGFSDGIVNGISSANDASGDIYVVGRFATYNGSSATGIARLNNDGSLDTNFSIGSGFDTGPGTNDEIRAAAVFSDGSGNVLVGGGFYIYNGTAVNNMIVIKNDGSISNITKATGNGFNWTVQSIAPTNDGSGKVYVGGWFSLYNGVTVNRLVRLTSNGEIDLGFNTGDGFNDGVEAVAIANDGSGDIYVGGRFTNFNGVAVNRLVRLNSDGTLDTGFNVGSGFNNNPTIIVIADDGTGDLYVSGGFSNYNGTPVKQFVRLNNDGTLDDTFNIGSGFNFAINSLAVTGSDIYVAGDFSQYNGVSVNHVVRLNSTGTVNDVFVAGAEVNDDVIAIALTNDGTGDIYVGMVGDGETGTGVSLLRLNNNGSVDTGFNIGTGFTGGAIESIALTDDGSGDIYVSGNYDHFNGTLTSGILRLNSTGSLDGGFVSGNETNNISTVVSINDGSGDIYIGGNIYNYSGITVNGLVKLNQAGVLY
ncbi:MAG: hypothetical protein OEZ39_02640 [Gammaproteobacteria bacterium]|nr:hypothetical protein [Gammaproteobacteria bacterium]MDH5650753.1 hypothetical protein [Gammaproteobacteria bacterium]